VDHTRALIGRLAKQAAALTTVRSKSLPASTEEDRRAALASLDDNPKASQHPPTRYGRRPYRRGNDSV
jgi:hypothetical protein